MYFKTSKDIFLMSNFLTVIAKYSPLALMISSSETPDSIRASSTSPPYFSFARFLISPIWFLPIIPFFINASKKLIIKLGLLDRTREEREWREWQRQERETQ